MEKEKFYKKQWFLWVMLVFITPVGLVLIWTIHKDWSMKKKVIISIIFGLLFVIGMFSYGGVADNETEKKESSNNKTVNEKVEEVEPEKDDEEEPEPEHVEPEITIGQANALDKAHDYLDFTAFSYTGLIGQLEFEGFTTEEATYAADNCGADWNEQAAIKAQDYLDFSSFSRQGLIDQLEYEGFTYEQSEYGVTQVGY